MILSPSSTTILIYRHRQHQPMRLKVHLHASTDNDSVDDGDDHLDHHHHYHDLVTDVIKSASDFWPRPTRAQVEAGH